VFLCGLAPAAVAFVVRLFVREPERWVSSAAGSAHPRLADLFTPANRRLTLGGFCMSLVALIMWWGCSSFIGLVSTEMARASAKASGLGLAATRALIEGWKTRATVLFSLGGLVGTLLTVPLAKVLGRRPMFGIYFAASGAALLTTFGLDLPSETRILMYGLIGLTVFGVFGSFTYYLPELFPTRLRGTGAGFCYNVGRIIAAGGPFLVGTIAARGADTLASALQVLFWVGFVPLAGLLLLPLAIETKGRQLN
jgi:hypothetical protein